mgnify:CR=1 FL=1
MRRSSERRRSRLCSSFCVRAGPRSSRRRSSILRASWAVVVSAVIVWPLLCGMAKAKYYLLLCEAVDGQEAERIGLVSMCGEDDELEAKGLEVATKIGRAHV